MSKHTTTIAGFSSADWSPEVKAAVTLLRYATEVLDALKQAVAAMERDWHTIDQEWGPTMQEFGDLEGAIRQKHESTDAIRSARAAIAKAEGQS